MKQPDPDRPVVAALMTMLILGLAGLVVHVRHPGDQAGLALNNLMLVAVALGHAWFLMGWRRAVLFFGMAFSLSWMAESLSIATALCGPYHYTALFGPCLGRVPVVVPLGWAAMIYNSSIIANLMAEGRPLSRPLNQHRGGAWTVGLALLTALVMSAWDLTLDPYMVTQAKAWVWDQGGAYFGIPIANYLSWVETTFMISIAIRLLEPALPWPPRPRASALVLAFPVLGYGMAGLADVFVGMPQATRLLSPFAMGIPVLCALGRVRRLAPEEAA